MRTTILAAVAAAALTGAAAGSLIQLAAAQPAAPPGPPMENPEMMRGPGMGREGMMWHPGWMRRMHMMMMHERHADRFAERGALALFYHPVDRQLSTADVQKIAEAFLLWNGNHTWKVSDVTENPDNSIGFAYAASDGTVIARFSMDRRTGHLMRTG